jgi:hypothetical protein
MDACRVKRVGRNSKLARTEECQDNLRLMSKFGARWRLHRSLPHPVEEALDSMGAAIAVDGGVRVGAGAEPLRRFAGRHPTTMAGEARETFAEVRHRAREARW